jgi:hypothetical protein
MRFLDIRAQNCLLNFDIRPDDFDTITKMLPSELLSLPGLGKTSLLNLREYLLSHGRDFDVIDVDCLPIVTAADAERLWRRAVSARDKADKAVLEALAVWEGLKHPVEPPIPENEPRHPRNWSIWRSHMVDGLSKAETGRRYGLSGTRVSQIIAKHRRMLIGALYYPDKNKRAVFHVRTALEGVKVVRADDGRVIFHMPDGRKVPL